MYKIPANTLFAGQKLIYVPECHSTSSSLAELLERADLPEGTVFITDHQTQGRGQRGNRWDSGRSENLTFSLLLRPRFLPPVNQFELNMAVALGILGGLVRWVPEGISLKWPNDIMIGDRKVGGILIESQSQGAQLSVSIVGIGLNVNQVDNPHPNAASLVQTMGHALDLNEVFQALVASLESKYLQLRAGAHETIRSEYLARLYRRNVPQRFESKGQEFVGSISGVDELGRLCVQVGNETRKFSLKEITMVPGM